MTVVEADTWLSLPIREVAPLQRGFDLPTSKIQEGNFPVVYSNGIERFHSKAMVRGPGVVTGRSGTLGKVHYVKSEFWPHNTSLWVTNFKGNDPKYVYYLFSYIGFKRFASGSGVPTLNRNDAHNFEVCLPSSCKEQGAIADALSDADALIEGLESLIAKKRAIKQGAMQELLTGRRRLPGFDGEWEKKTLGVLAQMKSGEGITSRDIDNVSPFPCYGGNGLRGYTARYTHEGRYALIGRVGALCGNLNIVEGRFFASEHAIVVEPMQGVSIDWLALVLDAMRLNRLSEASAQPVLTVSKLEKLEIATPTNQQEQVEIAKIISDLSAEIEALSARLQKARQIKQGMMQELLTGRIRLV